MLRVSPARFSLVAAVFLFTTLALHASRQPNYSPQLIALPAAADGTGPTIVLDVVPSGIEAAVFAPDGTIVQVETRRGAATPAELREVDPSTPPYEIDVRFLDSDGFPFLIILGGHEPIDPTWRLSPSVTALTTEITEQRAKAQYETALGFLQTIARSEFGSSVELFDWYPERQALLGSMTTIAEATITRSGDASTPDASNGTHLRAVNTATTPTNVYRWEIEIHKQGFWFASNTFGDHSATITRSVSKTGVVQQTVVSNNHGTMADKMPLSCKYGGTPAIMPKTLPQALMCSTSYGLVKGTHVCNDDTYIQYQSIHDMLCPDPKAGTCSDSSLRRYAPSCW